MTRAFRFALTASLAVLAAADGGVAHAQSSACAQLEAQLIALDRGSGADSARELREYDTSIRQQEGEINRATAEARRQRCIGGFFIQRHSSAPQCKALLTTIDRQKANLRRLREARSRHRGDPFAVSRQRNDILRAMQSHRCPTVQARVRTAPRGGGLLSAIFGQGRTRSYGEDTFFQGSTGLGTYRTLCVRACDGYYFPISFSTVPGQFQADEAACRAMCPGADVSLFTHRNPGEESDSMVSLTGQSYSALPTAFRYRQEYDPGCGCGTPATVTASLGTGFDLSRRPLAAPLIALPKTRPAISEDPETLANRAGGFTIRRAPRDSGAVVAELPGAPEVRVVGPSFYYGQKTEIGMLLPAQKPPLRDESDRISP